MDDENEGAVGVADGEDGGEGEDLEAEHRCRSTAGVRGRKNHGWRGDQALPEPPLHLFMRTAIVIREVRPWHHSAVWPWSVRRTSRPGLTPGGYWHDFGEALVRPFSTCVPGVREEVSLDGDDVSPMIAPRPVHLI